MYHPYSWQELDSVIQKTIQLQIMLVLTELPSTFDSAIKRTSTETLRLYFKVANRAPFLQYTYNETNRTFQIEYMDYDFMKWATTEGAKDWDFVVKLFMQKWQQPFSSQKAFQVADLIWMVKRHEESQVQNDK